MIRSAAVALGAMLFTGAASLADASPAWPPAWASDGAVLKFDVLRDGKPLGVHEVRFERDGDAVGVTVDVDLKVSIGPFTPFKYRHDVREEWRGGSLTALSSTTLKDGRDLSVDVTSGEGLPAGAVPTTWWNQAVLSQDALFNSETGAMIPATATRLGTEVVQVDGLQVEATHWRIDSEMVLDLWYDAEGRWVKCAFTARGSKIEYVLVEAARAGL